MAGLLLLLLSPVLVSFSLPSRSAPGYRWQYQSADDYYHGPQKSPDGRWEAYTRVNRFPDAEQRNDWVSDVSLYIRNIRTGKEKRLVRVAGRVNVPVTAGWSPDSKRVLYWSLISYGSSSVNADGSGLRDVSIRGGRPRELSDRIMRKPECITFSPDGRLLLLVEGWSRFMVEFKRLVQVEYWNGKRRFLTSKRIAAIEPAWSKDVRHIAYTATRDGHWTTERDSAHQRWSHMHLWVMNSNGSGKRQLTSDASFHELSPHWTGSRSVRFTRVENGGANRLSNWEIRSDGTGLRRIR